MRGHFVHEESKRRRGATLMSPIAERASCLEKTSVIKRLGVHLFMTEQASLGARRALVQRKQTSPRHLFVRKQMSLRVERELVLRKRASLREASGHEGPSPVEVTSD